MVLLETIHTLRRKIPENLNFEGESRATCDLKKPLVHEATNRFVENIKELSRLRKKIGRASCRERV